MKTARRPQQASKTLLDFAPHLPRPAVVCTLVSVAGSVPQDVGARMWVSGDRAEGTLGGGRFEAEVLARARALLRQPGAKPELREFVLCKQLGQCCGGRARVFFEPVASAKAAHVFGGGHVGRALAEALAGTPVTVTVVDPRSEWSVPEGLPEGVGALHADPLEYARSRDWTERDAVCILTHSHDLDFELARFFVDQPVRYLGLIGSEHKARVFQARLQTLRGPGTEDLWESKVRCPMGERVASKSPKVIALSVSLELLRALELA